MSTSTVRFIIALVLIAHGIGYSLAFFPALIITKVDNWNYQSWLLSGVLGDTGSRIVIIILFGITAVGFIAAGLGVLGFLIPHESWQTLAIVSAVVGLIALALFWNAFPSLFPNKIGAIVVNVLVLLALLGTNSLSNMADAI